MSLPLGRGKAKGGGVGGAALTALKKIFLNLGLINPINPISSAGWKSFFLHSNEAQPLNLWIHLRNGL